MERNWQEGDFLQLNSWLEPARYMKAWFARYIKARYIHQPTTRYMKAYTDTERDPWEGCLVRWAHFHTILAFKLKYTMFCQTVWSNDDPQTIQQLRDSLLWCRPPLRWCCRLSPPQGFCFHPTKHILETQSFSTKSVYIVDLFKNTKVELISIQLSRAEAREMEKLERKWWQRWKIIQI